MEALNFEGKQYSLDSLELEVGNQIGRYKKEVEKIQKSDDPVYDTPGKRQYEVDKVKKQLDENIGIIERIYKQLGEELIDEQMEYAARNPIKPTSTDTDTAKATAEDFGFTFSMAYSDEDKLSAVKDLEDKIAHFTDAQKVALRRQFPQIMKQAQDQAQDQPQSVQRKLSAIGHDLQGVISEEEGGLAKLRQAVKAGPATEYRVMLAAQKASARHRRQMNGSSDTIGDTYEVEYMSI